MRVLIGSRAIKHWFPDFPREPKDTDYSDDTIACPVIERGEDGIIERYPIPAMIFRKTDIGLVASPDSLYTLKVSHIFWDIKWEKTMFDIVWLQKKGCAIEPQLLVSLWKHWEEVHGVPSRAQLDMKADEFFDNAIPDGHDHDRLHTFIKDPPTYTKILQNPDEPGAVAINEEKFWQLSHEDKLNIVREECYVMAYERMGNSDYRDAYLKQLKAWILHHGPSREMALFAVRNYDELRVPTINYKEVIDYGKQSNDVR